MSADAPATKIAADRGRAFSRSVESLVLYVAVRPARLEAPRRHRVRCAARVEARAGHGALLVQMGDRRAGRRGDAARFSSADPRGAGCACARLQCRPLHRDGLRPAPRRALRARRPARRAPARLPDLRASARPFAALPPGAADRRPVPHHRARHDRHRDDRPACDPERRSDRHRIRADRGDRLVPVRIPLRRGDRGHRPALCLVHDPGERLADHHPPRDERFRHRRAFQGHRTRCSTTRRSSISATSIARRSASTVRWRDTSAPPCEPGRRSPL